MPETLEEAWILGISDIHLGDPNFDDKYFLRCRKWVEETSNCYVIINGDIMNTAIKNSISDIYSETIPPKEQLSTAIKLFEPIKEKIIAVVNGNHEHRIYKEVGFNVLELFADKLGCYYAGDEVYLKVTLGKNSHNKRVAYNIYATHGYSNGRTSGSKVNSLQKLSDIVLADLYFGSHTHFPATFKDSYLIPDPHNNNLIEIERTYVNTNAFLLRGGYAIRKCYSHANRSLPRARLSGKQKKIEVII